MASGTPPRLATGQNDYTPGRQLQPDTSPHEDRRGARGAWNLRSRPRPGYSASDLFPPREGPKIISSGTPGLGDDRRLHLGHFGDARHAGAFVEDLDAV